MPYNTKQLLKDNSQYQPIPQYYNPTTDLYEPVTGQFGGANVNIVGSGVQDVILINAISSVGRGTDQMINGNKTLTFEVFGTATSFSLQMEGKSKSGTPYSLQAINLSTMSGMSTITAAGIYQIDVTGLVSVDANLTAVTGGNVTVQGKLVS